MTDDDAATPPHRRGFLETAIAAVASALGVLAAYPALQFLKPRPIDQRGLVRVGNVDDFPIGSSKTVVLGQRPVLVLRLDDGSFRAFVALCTHLQCVVGYSSAKKRIECACHHGVFSLHGKNVAGPPPRPLEALAVHVANGVVTVTET